MGKRKDLLKVTYHSDDDTGMYRVGELGFGVCGNLNSYIKKYGYKGVEGILATLGHLSWEVKDRYFKLKSNKGGDKERIDLPF